MKNQSPQKTLFFFQFQGGSCFLFDCGPPLPGEFLCRFTSNDMFTSAALEVNRHEFEDSQYQARESHAADLTSLLGGDYSNPNYPNRDSNPNIRIDPNPNIIQMDPAPPSRDQIVNNQRRRPLPAPEREQPTVEVPAKTAGRTYIF